MKLAINPSVCKSIQIATKKISIAGCLKLVEIINLKCLTTFIPLLLFPNLTFAFYTWENDTQTGEIRGLIRGFAVATKNPEASFFYEDKSVNGAAAVGRVILESHLNETISIDINADQTYIPKSLAGDNTSITTAVDTERSSALEWSFSDDKFIHLALDRLNIRWSVGDLDLTIGRQTINLANTFYFTPNDFFAPFSAQTFYRVYKPGVDAIRAEVRLDDLSQLSLISVLGYQQDPGGDTGWSQSPDSSRVSHIGRVSTVYWDTEWALLLGEVRNEKILGGAIQGELFEWLGIRAEGHVAEADDNNRHTELSLGLEHRWENSLNAQMELFYHGNGVNEVSDYPLSATTNNQYLARRYMAIGANYQFSPLLIGNAVTLANLIDHSYLLALNAVYSLSDESDLTINLNLPVGDGPEISNLKSEFGLVPKSLNIEVRSYF